MSIVKKAGNATNIPRLKISKINFYRTSIHKFMKKLLTSYLDNTRYLKKTILIMKLSTLLLFVNLLQISAIGLSQTERFTIKGEGIQIRDLLDQVESESDYKFLYRSEYVNDKQVSLDAESVTLEDLLSLAFINSDITYQMLNDKLIVIAPKAFADPVQDYKITGKVTDASTGEPLPGVNILIEGTLLGTISDVDGNYSIEVPNTETVLLFSFVGYITERMEVGSRVSLDVTLVQDIQKLDEVVVIGYGTVKKKDLTGAVSSIQAKDLGNSTVANVGQMIQGRVAGVEISTGDDGGRPGGAMNIKIRGTTSINETDPLTIIDGMEGDADMVAPSEIESVDILKDASSAAIYGSRGANGVIIITTKKGKAGTPRFNYDGYYGVSTPIKKLDLLNASDYIDLVYDIEGGAYNQNTGHWDKPAGMPTIFDDDAYVRTDRVNMQDELFRNANVQSHSIDLTGGTESTKYRVSAGYFDQGSTRGNYNYSRYNLKVNFDTKIGKRLTIGNNTLFRHIKTTGQEGNIGGAIRWAPYVGVFSEDSPNPGKYSFITNEDNLNDAVNPMTNLEYDINNDQGWKILTQLYADVDIIEGLKFHSQFQYEYESLHNLEYREKDFRNGVDQTNYLEEYYKTANYPRFENYLTYNKTIGSHVVTLLGGINFEKGLGSREITARGTGYGGESIPVKKPTAGGSSTISNSAIELQNSLSYFARFNYSLLDRYLLTVNFRADASYKFAPANRWGYFPSVAMGWKLKEEAFLRDVSWLSALKVRVSWGKAGNDKIGEFLFNSNIYTGGYSGGDNIIVYPFGLSNDLGHAGYGATVNAIPSPSIRWEETTTEGLGLDAGFLNDRLSVSFDYYHKMTEGVLIEVPVPLSTGITSPQVKNAATVVNKGVDLQLNYRGVAGNGLNYNLSVVGGYNKNNVESLGDGQPIFGVLTTEVGYMTRTASGFPIGYYYGYKTDGILYTQADADAYNEKFGNTIPAEPGDMRFKDLNGDGKISDADRTNLGNAMPKWTYGLNLSMSYRMFDFRVTFTGIWGNQLINFNRAYWLEGGVRPFNGSASMLERWRFEGDTDAKLPRVEETDPNKNTRFSNRYIEDGSYGRLKNVTLGYTLNNKWFRQALSSFRVYATVENAFTITKYTGYDPDFGGGDNIERGRDEFDTPLPRNFLFGVQVSF